MLRKVVSRPEISRYEKSMHNSGRSSSEFFFIQHNGYNRHHKGSCWEFRVFTSLYSNKGYHAGLWRTRLIVSGDDFDELLSYVSEIVSTQLVFVRTTKVVLDGKEMIFANEREAWEYRETTPRRETKPNDIWLDDLEVIRPDIVMPK